MKNRKILALALAFVMVFSLAASAASYTVVKDDVLWKIAKAHGTTWQKLAEMNNLKNPNLIRVGQILQVGETTMSGEPVPVSGTFTGTGKGFGGDVKVEITLNSNSLTAVKVLSHTETPGIGTIAIEKLPAAIVKKQSTKVDAIANATVTSKAILAGVSAALKTAGLSESDLSAPVTDDAPVSKTAKTVSYDIVIVGAGGAGLTAALEAKAAGKSVLVLEKMPMAGGNTNKATGGMNASNTEAQKAKGVVDSVDAFVADAMKAGENLNDKALITALGERSASAVAWLKTIGGELPLVGKLAGASVERAHKPAGGSAVGPYLMKAFLAAIENNKIEVLYDTQATEILMNNGSAVGVKATSPTMDYTVNAKAVILASGGFGYNESMISTLRPELAGFVKTNHSGATGDGIAMAEKVGAAVVDMSQIQIHPTVEQSKSIMITEAVRGNGAILVNQAGKRFGNEMTNRANVSKDIMAQTGKFAYIVFDDGLRKATAAVESYFKNSIVTEGATLADLAGKLGVPAADLETTFATWNKSVAAKKDDAFSRPITTEKEMLTGPFYAVKIAPGIHHTMGGVKINTSTEVVNTKGAVIPGLFAAGEVTGGIHGADRLGGNAVSDIVVFGREAGINAAKFVK